MRKLIPSGLMAIMAIVAMPMTASADLVNQLVPSWAGSSVSSSGTWNSFSNAFGAPNFSDNPQFSLTNTSSPAALITGTGNIYDPAAPLNVSIAANTAPADAIVLNIATMGTELGFVELNIFGAGGESANFSADASYTRFYQTVPGFGSIATHAFSWTNIFDKVGFAIDSYAISFRGTAPHMSLDAVSIYTAVPGPGAIALLGLAGVSARRRRN